MLRATVAPPGAPPLVVYCAHFEVFCGMLARLAQLADVLVDARTMIDKVRCLLAAHRAAAAPRCCFSAFLTIQE